MKRRSITPSTIKPDVSAGVKHSRFYNVDLPGFKLDNNSYGGALQAGVDIAVTQNGYLNFDVKKTRIDTPVQDSATGTTAARLDSHPVVCGIVYGLRC